jgi:hypothetical protein
MKHTSGPAWKLFVPVLVISSIITVSASQTQQMYIDKPETANPALAEFGLSGKDIPRPIYVVRTKRPIPPASGAVVHAQKGDCYLVSGPRETADYLRRYGCQVIPVDDGTWPRPAAPPAWKGVAAKDPIIQRWVNRVSWPRIEPKIRKLQNFGTRYKHHPNRVAVAETLLTFFHRLGLEAELQTFTQPSYVGVFQEGYNVVATQPGVEQPGKTVILCGHYDSTSEIPMSAAPGADDNATGVAAVMTAAEILSEYQFKYTIEYICFAAEELGGWGSGTYARRAKAANKKIIGAINVDMLGWRRDNGDVYLEVEANKPSSWLGKAVRNTAMLYTGRLCRIRITDTGWSDNISFWQMGFAAVNCEEDWAITGADFNPNWHTTTDLLAYLKPTWTVGNVKVAVAALATLAEPVHPPPTGSIAGRVTADCAADSTGLLGVVVDAYSVDLGQLVRSDKTDAAGEFEFADLAAGDYTVSLVTPLGYMAPSEEIEATVTGGQTTTIDLPLNCGSTASESRGIGYWKHQFAVALCGKGHGHIDDAGLCDYLDAVELHFNNNALNPVVVYEPPASGACSDKLGAASSVLNIRGNLHQPALAKRHLMALLLNVASGKLSPWKAASKDGATVSQAITYCDSLLDDADAWNDWVAQYIAAFVNIGWPVCKGMIPLGTRDIAYAPPVDETAPAPGRLSLTGAYPNPFNPSTTIRFTVPVPEMASLRIYDVRGRLVRSLVDGPQPAGECSAVWDGVDSAGSPAASGVYFVRLESGGQAQTKKILLLK